MFNLEKTLSFQYGSIIGYMYIFVFVSLFQLNEFGRQFGMNHWLECVITLIILYLLLFCCLIFFGIFSIIDYKFYNHIKNIKTTKNSFYRVIQYIGFGIYVLISLSIFLLKFFKPPYIGLIESVIFLIVFLFFPNKKSEDNQLEEGNINDEE